MDSYQPFLPHFEGFHSQEVQRTRSDNRVVRLSVALYLPGIALCQTFKHHVLSLVSLLGSGCYKSVREEGAYL